MKQVRLSGTGQLNGALIIDKTIELDDKIAGSLTGPKRNEVKLAILAVHYPGVRIPHPNNISVTITDIPKVSTDKQTLSQNTKSSKSDSKKSKPTFTFSNIVLWILFFPFKLVWWIFKNILKSIWQDDHMSNRKWDKF